MFYETLWRWFLIKRFRMVGYSSAWRNCFKYSGSSENILFWLYTDVMSAACPRVNSAYKRLFFSHEFRANRKNVANLAKKYDHVRIDSRFDVMKNICTMCVVLIFAFCAKQRWLFQKLPGSIKLKHKTTGVHEKTLHLTWDQLQENTRRRQSTSYNAVCKLSN